MKAHKHEDGIGTMRVSVEIKKKETTEGGGVTTSNTRRKKRRMCWSPVPQPKKKQKKKGNPSGNTQAGRYGNHRNKKLKKKEKMKVGKNNFLDFTLHEVPTRDAGATLPVPNTERGRGKWACN